MERQSWLPDLTLEFFFYFSLPTSQLGLSHFYGSDIVNIMSKKSVLSGILNARCPRCREEKMFTHGLLNLKKVTSMHQNCPNCNLRFEKEPGNFYGAMYVSYAFSTGLFLVIAFILYHFFNDPPIETYLITIFVIAAILFPINFRYSRVVFLYLIWKTQE